MSLPCCKCSIGSSSQDQVQASDRAGPQQLALPTPTTLYSPLHFTFYQLPNSPRSLRTLGDHCTLCTQCAASTPYAFAIPAAPLPWAPTFPSPNTYPSLRPRLGVHTPESLAEFLQRGGRSPGVFIIYACFYSLFLSCFMIIRSHCPLTMLSIFPVHALLQSVHHHIRPSPWGQTMELSLICILFVFLSSEPGTVLGNQ